MSIFDVPGAAATVVNSINDKGELAGYYEDANFAAHGFATTSTGKIKTFDVSGAAGTYPNNINNHGLVTGWYTDAEGDYHGFLRTK
jgi:hypothetical protein